MMLLSLFLLVGLACASSYEDQENAADDFIFDIENVPSSREFAEETEATELGKVLRESLNNVLEEIYNNFIQGKEVTQELVDKAKEISAKLKEIGEDAGEEAKSMLEKIKEQSQEWFKNLLEKMGVGN